MNNKELYKKAFSVLQTSGDFSLEDGKMAKLQKKAIRKNIAAAAAACLIILGCSGTAYAANIGGIQRTLQLWVHGDQTNVTIDFDGAGNYNMEYLDKDGNRREKGGGGVAIYENGTERPLTEKEIITYLSQDIDVEYYDDGQVILYFQDQIVDITDKFENGYCYVCLKDPDHNLYATVKYQDGWATSRVKYPSVD